ncbi:PREDICTED: splicing factor 1-like [Prunus mume]|uniref:Splicing factor 1-like n=1 Tax=Prunus mume TaxID=102107 RepID=A0ABM0PB92_PRUMU|nr:PREDICTED: splicing factor 1-like [Prunus mume]
MYMITATTGGGAMYHAPPPMVRPVTGPPGQGYYHMQQRMGSEVYREQPVYNVVPQPQQQPSTLPPQQQPSNLPPQPQPSSLPPQPPKYVATYAEASPYTQMAYDSVTGRQVYYTAPGGGIMQPPQQQAYQAVGPPAVGGELRVASGLSQEGKVVGSKLPQTSV